jgi:hypothetical protein
MAHIFLSYSREDAAIMEQMRSALQDAGCGVWTDEDLSRGSDDWQKAIEASIETARCLVVLLSPTAKNSVWVRREISYAETQEVPIFPILARGTPKDAVPAAVINHQRADIRTDDDDERQRKINRQAKIISDYCRD